jgi:hypothetical protein
MAPIEFKNPADAALDQGIKMLPFGGAGSGKTVLAQTTKEPTILVSAEAGLLSLRHTKADIKVVEVHNMDDIEGVYNHLVGGSDFKWIFIDSVSEIAEVVLAHELLLSKDPRKSYGEMATKMIQLIKMFRDLPGYDLVMTAKMSRVQDDNGKFVYGPSMPGRQLGHQLPYLFDVVTPLRVERNAEGDLERMMQMVRDDQFEAKDRSGRLDRFEEPNLAKIKAKILNNTAQKKAA